MKRQPLTELAHRRLAARLRPGDWVVDATAGNGHDTLFLARTVSPGGRVFAFDVQCRALAATRRRLQAADPDATVTLIRAGHQRMARHLPPAARGRLAAVMFNLGYLPGADKSLVTRPDTTLAALTTAAEWLAPGGLLSILAYRHHPGGADETAAVTRWLDDLADWRIERHASPGPLWLLAQRPHE